VADSGVSLTGGNLHLIYAVAMQVGDDFTIYDWGKWERKLRSLSADFKKVRLLGWCWRREHYVVNGLTWSAS